MKKTRGTILVMCLVLAIAALAVVAGCGKTDRGSNLKMDELVTPQVSTVEASSLPGDFAKLTKGMTVDQAVSTVGKPATIQDPEGTLRYKYFIDKGQKRVYLIFAGGKKREGVKLDNTGYKLDRMEWSTP